MIQFSTYYSVRGDVTVNKRAHVETSFFTQNYVQEPSGVPRGGVGVSTPPPARKAEVLTKLSRISSPVENTSVTVLCSYFIILISLKIAEFRTPTPQDVRKKTVKF
jgi:hypothetical protein